MKQIIKEIETLKLGSVNLLALVTTTYSDVVFVASMNGKKYQSGMLAEESIVDNEILDSFYVKIADVIRKNLKFDSSKLNVVTIDGENNVNIRYEPIDARVYGIKKEWMASLSK